MKANTLYHTKHLIVAMVTLFMSVQVAFAQDALTSVKVNIQNVKMSSDGKTLSYDVYVQDVDATNQIAIPGYVFRLAVPQAELGANAKTVTLTNVNAELGATAPTMSVNSTNWLMKFLSANLITSYGTALMASETFPGTLLATFNISNTDGTSFNSPLTFEALFSGVDPLTKTTISIFDPGTTNLSPNSITAQPASNISGLGQYNLNANTISLTITNPTITVSKTYDGNTTASVTAGTISGILPGDVGNVSVTTTAMYNNSTVGTGKTITTSYSLTGVAASKYSAPSNYVVLTGEITKKLLTIGTPATVTKSKPYDGSTSAAVTATAIPSPASIVGSEVVTLNTTGTYNDASVATGKTITLAYTLAGANAGNYTAPASTQVTNCEITQNNSALDALTSVHIFIKNYTLSSDRTTLSYDVYLKDVDANNEVTIPGFLFRMAIPQADLGAKAKTVTVTNASAELGATGVSMTASGSNWLMIFKSNALIQDYGSALKLSESGSGTLIGTFNIKNTDGALFNSPLTFSSLFSGTTPLLRTYVSIFNPGTITLAPNSTSPQPIENFTGLGAQTVYATTIPLTIANPTLALSKTYNGNASAMVTVGALSGVLPVDLGNVTISATATYDNANIGTGKTITTVYTLSGSSAVFYTKPADYVVTTGEITKKLLTIGTPATVTKIKIYDGNTTAAVTATAIPAPASIIGSEAVTLTTAGTYDNKNFGTTKTITLAYTLAGDAGVIANYASPANTTFTDGEITKKLLTIATPAVVTKTKPYDGNNTAAVTATAIPGNIVGAEDVTLTTVGTYNNAIVANGKTITLAYTLAGAALGNYSAPANTTYNDGVVTAKQLTTTNPTLTLTKIWDGSANAAVIKGTLSGVVNSEDVTLNATASYANANAGIAKTITVSYSLSGYNVGSYTAPADYVVATGEIYKRLTINVLLEGLWNGSMMNQCKDENSLPIYGNDIADLITIELHNPTKYSVIDNTLTALELHQAGKVTSAGMDGIALPGDLTGTYRITIKSRNHLETTSAALVSFTGNSISYDFTDAVEKSYASDPSFTPTKKKDGKWMLYAGDSKSGSYPEINFDDLYDGFNNRSGAVPNYGYSIQDFDGDGAVELDDNMYPYYNRDVLLYLPDPQ